jgi:hypothetical protein
LFSASSSSSPAKKERRATRKHPAPHRRIQENGHAHARLLHPAQHTRLRHVRHVDEDVVRGVAVQRGPQALLVEVVSDEPDAAPEDEQAVQRADLRW